MTELADRAAPLAATAHLVDTGSARMLFVPDGSRLYELDDPAFAQLAALERRGDEAGLADELTRMGVGLPQYVDDQAPTEPPIRALSLAVAERCNLGCQYCYADGGGFGGAATLMTTDTALASVDLLFGTIGAGDRVNLAFLGGEPLLNRPVIWAATELATELARQRDAHVGFSMTTNGTRLTDADGDFFEAHGFAVTVSLDGVGETHDRLRPFRNGRGSFEKIVERVTPLLQRQRAMQISARVTVTPTNLGLRETLDHLLRIGFHGVGFSPLLRSPTGQQEMTSADLAVMLKEMIACGASFESHVVAGERYAFTNAATAMRELHRGTHRPYPCGAGAGYLGVSGDGEIAACHRFVGDPQAAMGSVTRGVDRTRQLRWLEARHVHRQEPCQRCWARYLCGGGCHHEVIARGRPACDYIRGWLQWCLEAYGRLSALRPDYFGP